MNYTIKAHPTEYAGVLFRSRLEARWAAFFDIKGVPWRYEPFDLVGWTPDFELKARGKWLAAEVKPLARPTDFDLPKMRVGGSQIVLCGAVTSWVWDYERNDDEGVFLSTWYEDQNNETTARRQAGRLTQWKPTQAKEDVRTWEEYTNSVLKWRGPNA